MKITFTPDEIAFIEARGSSVPKVEAQFTYFEKGFPFADLQRAATIGDGIKQMTAEEIAHYINVYEQKSKELEILKFVPASGAASRMFKELQTIVNEKGPIESEIVQKFRENIKNFAFYSNLRRSYEKLGNSWESDINSDKIINIIAHLLEETGLNYSNLPKALLQFHTYSNETRTALEEHFVEAARYARGKNNECKLHFTVSPQHLSGFQALAESKKAEYEERYDVRYQLSYSTQDPATDTLAATEENLPFHDSKGNLLFRPGGHGALIQNLNHLSADIVFVKNIDNVITENQISDTVTYKKALAGYLLWLQEKSFAYQEKCKKAQLTDDECLEIQHFAEEKLQIVFSSPNATQNEILAQLHRPIRICGMVKNEGEPGGGPFWVKSCDGSISCQIIESSQIDKKSESQKKIMENATHFNPVDMVCGYRDKEGLTFDLTQFIDPNTGFISEKSHEGKMLKAMELPGLWNGAMAHWITLFVEVPLTTFHPVKTVFDLLKH